MNNGKQGSFGIYNGICIFQKNFTNGKNAQRIYF